MIHKNPIEVLERMAFLEAIDLIPKDKHLRQISAGTGIFLAIMAGSAPVGQEVEIGARAGYSALSISLVQENALSQKPKFDHIAICFLDANKVVNINCNRMVVPNLVSGGIFIADNFISHAAELGKFLQTARPDERVDALMFPIGKGLFVCRKL